MNTHNTPILIVSMPRSGSSLLSHILFNEGVQVGDCKKGDEYNKYGYYENIIIRNILIKYLNKHDVNNLKKKFQPINLLEDYKDFNRKVYRAIKKNGIVKNKPWLFKEPKIALCWNLFKKYYPDAKWILLYRNKEQVLSSYNNAKFMDAYNTKEDWYNYMNVWDENMKLIKDECKNVYEFNIESIFENKIDDINKLFDFIGITNTNKYIECVDKKIFTT